MLKLMYITNDPRVAQIAQQAGVDRIFVDLEYIGKAKRQGGMDTVQNHHTPDDVRRIKEAFESPDNPYAAKAARESVISKADADTSQSSEPERTPSHAHPRKSQVLARVNPWHEASPGPDSYCSSIDEINQVIEAGADIVMLPYFKTTTEVSNFIGAVGGRAQTMLLLETQSAVDCLDDILEIPGIDEIHIGINDLSIDQHKKFMFQLLTDGTVEAICKRIEQNSDIPYGIGGIAALGRGRLPSDYIIKEHRRLGSSICILSRSFCNIKEFSTYDAIENQFDIGVKAIRAFERSLQYISRDSDMLRDNLEEMTQIVNEIVAEMQ